MVGYRAITRGCVKLLRANLVRACGRWPVLCAATIAIGLFLFLSLRISWLSSLKDLGEAKFVELNAELAKLPAIPPESSDTWRQPRVKDARILSAYLETRPEVVLEEDSSLHSSKGHAWAMIRIIGIVPVNLEKSRLLCYYRYRYADEKGHTTVAKNSMVTRLAAFQENFGMFYCAAHILCELPGRHDDNNIKLPYEVTIASEPVTDPNADLTDQDFVVVRYPRHGWSAANSTKSTSNDETIAVCVQPLHHRFDRDLDLVAFVEYYRMMGVGRFTFYRDSVSPRVGKIIDYYAREGVATVIEWRLPELYVYERNLRVDGIFAALNDCLYRSTYHSPNRYVAGVDVDEYIVPRRHDDFRQMMRHLNPGGKDAITGAWIFRNVFFYLMHRDDPVTPKPGSPRLQLHAKTTRWRETNPPWDRSKYIVQGRDVVDLGNHRVWKMKKAWSVFPTRYQEVAVDPRVAASHHYRKCETKVETCWKRPTEVDRIAHRFTVQLAARVSRVSGILFPQEAGLDESFT